MKLDLKLKDFAKSVAWSVGNARQKAQTPTFISGCPRSGTTWLLELAEHLAPSARRIWEPFNRRNDVERNGDEGCNFGLGLRPYLEEDASNQELSGFLERVFSNRIYGAVPITGGPQESSMAALERLIGRGPTIVKFVRAQRLLPWICQRFSVQGVMLVRNPLSVVASQITNDSWVAERSFAQEKLLSAAIRQRYPGLARVCDDCEYHEEVLAARCCIDYVIPLREIESCPNTMVLFYEHAVENRGGVLNDALRHLGVDIDLSGGLAPDRLVTSKPSATTAADSDVLSNKDPRQSWMRRLTQKQADRIVGVMNACGFQLYTTSSIYPLQESATLKAPLP